MNVSIYTWLSILRISAYPDGMREDTDQKNSEYGHFLRSVCVYLYFDVIH